MMQSSTDHNRYLKECFRLAAISAEQGESSVGALLVKDNAVLGKGTEQSRGRGDVTRHAEVVAILDAVAQHGADNCKGATLYTNVEPCILCSYVIRHYEISQVVYVKRAGEIGGIHSRFPILTTDEIKKWKTPPEVLEVLYDPEV